MGVSNKIKDGNPLVLICLFSLLTQVTAPFAFNYGMLSPSKLFEKSRNYFGGGTPQTNYFGGGIPQTNYFSSRPSQTNYFGAGAAKTSSYSSSVKIVNGKVVEDKEESSGFQKAFTDDNGNINEIGQVIKADGPKKVEISYTASRAADGGPSDVNVFVNKSPDFEVNTSTSRKRRRKPSMEEDFFNSDHTLYRRSPDQRLREPIDPSLSVSADTNVSISPDGQPHASAKAQSEGGEGGGGSEKTSTSTITTPDGDKISTASTSSSGGSSSWWPLWNWNNEDSLKMSPYSLLKYVKPTDTSISAMTSMFGLYSDLSSESYLSTATTILRVLMFFMPGTGLLDQICFTIAMTKIIWQAACVYYKGYSLKDLYCFLDVQGGGDDSMITNSIMVPGETINVAAMDVTKFLSSIQSMNLPPLLDGYEETLKSKIESLVSLSFSDIAEGVKTKLVNGLMDATKFLSLFNTEGNLIGDGVSDNFSKLFSIPQFSRFEPNTPLETIKKKITEVINMLTGGMFQ